MNEQLDPNDRRRPQPEPARICPYVAAALVVALAVWAYLEPIPTHTRPEPISIGPASPLYGPLTTTKGE